MPLCKYVGVWKYVSGFQPGVVTYKIQTHKMCYSDKTQHANILVNSVILKLDKTQHAKHPSKQCYFETGQDTTC